MTAFMPAWRPLDVTHSGRLLSERPRGGRVVALCVSPGLAGRPEGARLAVSLARRWTEGGMGVVLADGDVAHPILHLAVGLPNGKGLADILLVGDAWESVALPTPAPGLRLIPAGGRAAPTNSQAARERLADLCREVPDGGQTLALYVPLGTEAAAWAIEVSTDIVVLSGEKEQVASFFADDEDRIRALVGPALSPRPRAAEAGAAPPAPQPSAPPARAPAAPPERAAAAPERAAPPPPRAPAPPERPAPPPMAREAPVEPLAEDRPPPSAARMEDKWAQAAAMLRATREGRAPEPPQAPSKPAAPAPPKAVAPEPAAPEPAAPERPTPPPPEPPTRAGHPGRAAPAPEPPRHVRPPRKPPLVDPLSLPPLAEAEPAHVGSEEEEAEARSARRRKTAIRAVAVVGSVAVVAGGVWIWNATRGMPPYEAWSTPLPRASLPPAETPAAAVPGQADTGAAAPETAAGSADSVPAPDSAPAPEAGAARVAETLPGQAPAATTRAPHQRYSWSISAMGTLEAARTLSERLHRAAPGEAFMVAPVVTGGRTLYRVLGGLAPDREALAATREGLGRATGLAAGGWLAREAPLAYALRDFGDAREAAAWAGELWGEGIPVYVLAVERDDGSVVHRVYSGAYASEEEAAPLRAVLQNAGICPETMSERRGRAGG